MSESYLLKCDCGKQTPVEPSQAGRKVRCACGKSLDVPALRALRKLPAPENVESVDQGAWSGRNRVLVIGVIVLAAAVLLGGFTLWRRPEPIHPDAAANAQRQAAALRQQADQFRDAVNRLSHDEWQRLRAAFDSLAATDLPEYRRQFGEHPYNAMYPELIAKNNNWLIVAGVLAGVGILMIASTHIMSAVKHPRGTVVYEHRHKKPTRKH